MNLDVPGLTPEMCQKRADTERYAGFTSVELRQGIQDDMSDATSLFRAALLEQYPARPELRVGDLAKFSDACVRVDHIGNTTAFVTWADSVEGAALLTHLIPTGEPAPDDWGQS